MVACGRALRKRWVAHELRNECLLVFSGSNVKGRTFKDQERRRSDLHIVLVLTFASPNSLRIYVPTWLTTSRLLWIFLEYVICVWHCATT